MLARMDVVGTGLRVTIDHAENRQGSALNLVEIYGRAVRWGEDQQLLDLIVRTPSGELDSSASDSLLL